MLKRWAVALLRRSGYIVLTPEEQLDWMVLGRKRYLTLSALESAYRNSS